MLPDILSRLVGERAACQKICLTDRIWSFVPLVEGSTGPGVLERSGLMCNQAGITGVGVPEVGSPGVPARAILRASPWFVLGESGVLG